MRFFHPVFWPALITVLTLMWAASAHNDYVRTSTVSYFLDSTGSLSIEEALRQSFVDSHMKQIPPRAKAIWVRMPIPNVVSEWDEDSVMFTGTNETVTSMRAYLVSPRGAIDLGFCDVYLKSKTCRIASLQYAFPMDHGGPASSEMLIRIEPSASAINNEFYVMKHTYFNRMTILLDHFVGLCTGTCFLTIVLSIVMFIIFREASFFALLLFYLDLVITICVNRGIWDAFFVPFIPIQGSQISLFVLSGALFCDMLFLKVFFHLNKTAPLLNRLYLTLMYILAIFALTSFNHAIANYVWHYYFDCVVVSGLLTLGTVLYFVWIKYDNAVPIAFGWSAGITFNVFWALYRFGIVGGVWFFGYYATFGRLVESVAMIIVVFLRLRTMTFDLGFARAKAEESNVVKTLLRMLSHDLSNTTQVILMSGQMMGPNRPHEVNEKSRERIVRAAKTQVEIIDHAKKSYLVRGHQLMELGPVNLNQCVRDMAVSFDLKINSKQQSLILKLSPDEPFVFGERATLEHQILANLISNAIKFTDRGKQITILTRSIDDKRAECRICDEGMGIPAEMREKLFSQSERVTRKGTDGEPGTGDGLLIVKDFTKMFEAEFEIQSEPGRGTEMILRFKRCQRSASADAVEVSASHHSKTDSPTSDRSR